MEKNFMSSLETDYSSLPAGELKEDLCRAIQSLIKCGRAVVISKSAAEWLETHNCEVKPSSGGTWKITIAV